MAGSAYSRTLFSVPAAPLVPRLPDSCNGSFTLKHPLSNHWLPGSDQSLKFPMVKTNIQMYLTSHDMIAGATLAQEEEEKEEEKKRERSACPMVRFASAF